MTKPVKAWACVERGRIDPTSCERVRRMEGEGERIIPVLITPIERSKRGKARKKPRRKSR